MGNIVECLNNIKNAVFGKDVRNAIYTGIKQCYDDAIANGHTDMEVAQARNTYNNLNSRLEADKNKIEDKIENEEINRRESLENIQKQVNGLAAGSPKGTYSSKGALESANPETGVYVITENGHIYSWNKDGITAIDLGLYQSTKFETDKSLTLQDNVADAKVVGDKINDYFEKLNYFDFDNAIINKSISENGQIVDAKLFIVTNFIKVSENDELYLQYFDGSLNSTPSITHIIKYDRNMNFVERINPIIAKSYTSDFDGYVRFNIQYIKSENIQYNMKNYFSISKNTLLDEYVKNYKFNSDSILNEINERLNDISEKLNCFVYDELLDNHSMQDNGYFLTTGNNYCATNKIKIKKGDVINLSYFGADNAKVYLYQVLKYTTTNDWIGRENLSDNSKTYTAGFDGYVRFNIYKTVGTNLKNTLVISKNKILDKYVDSTYRVISKYNTNKVNITRINDTLYKITFGKFNIDLFYTENETTNNYNWNLKEIRNETNIIVPTGTDIIGPVKINANNDFIGGVHGDETTDYITVSCDGASYDLEDINSIDCKTLTIVMKSRCFDEITKEHTFDRFIQIVFSVNKIFVSNSFKAVASCNLKRATNGGLIACRNTIIKDIIFNNSYFSEPPTISVSNSSNKNIMATINTLYGSVTVRNVTGHENDSYSGNLAVFTNENPMRCKVYFDTYKQGNYNINIGDTIDGSFEYIFS